MNSRRASRVRRPTEREPRTREVLYQLSYVPDGSLLELIAYG
jgi:hypothetical protein